MIPPDVRARLARLGLHMRRPAATPGHGLQASRYRGAGLEFAQYRGYQPGDEPRQVDWKLFARSDRFFVRQAERQSPLTAWLLVDASASMAQCDEGRPDWSRLDAARAIAACTIELALRQGDRFGVAAIAGDGVHCIPAGNGASHRDRCLLMLQGLRAGGTWPVGRERLRGAWETFGADTLVLMLGDFLDDAAATLAERLSAARRDVAVVQLLTVGERDFPYSGDHRFRDPETGQSLPGDGTALRAGFLARFGASREALARRFDAAGIRHATCVLDEPPDAPLRQLFDPRAASGTR